MSSVNEEELNQLPVAARLERISELELQLSEDQRKLQELRQQSLEALGESIAVRTNAPEEPGLVALLTTPERIEAYRTIELPAEIILEFYQSSQYQTGERIAKNVKASERFVDAFQVTNYTTLAGVAMVTGRR